MEETYKKRAFRVVPPSQNPANKRQIKGKVYQEILEKVRRIAWYQKQNKISNGIKGFIFYGDVGLGKTLCAKAVANELGAPLIFVDGADIARKFYGESEMQVAKIFEEAKKYRFSVILIDDAESVFPTRDWQKSESWHFAQNNVFFHCLDDLDSSSAIVILTTNRYDLLDKAVKDRLYPIEFPLPTKDVLIEIAEYKCGQLRMPPDSVIKAINKGKIKTIRELEKYIIERYIEEILRRAPI